MAAVCNFCKRVFNNKQGVRAHLKHCAKYTQRKGISLQEKWKLDSLGDSARIVIDDSEDIYFESEEEARLYDLKLKAQKRADERRILNDKLQKIRLKEEGEGQKRKEAYERERLEDEKKRQEREKRRIIQSVKQTVVDSSFLWDVPREAKAEAKVKIEKTLSDLPVLELPRSELHQIATGIRDKIFKPYLKTIEEEKTAKKEVIELSKKRLYSGVYYCPYCDIEFEIEREDEQELKCEECHTALEEADDHEVE